MQAGIKQQQVPQIITSDPASPSVSASVHPFFTKLADHSSKTSLRSSLGPLWDLEEEEFSVGSSGKVQGLLQQQGDDSFVFRKSKKDFYREIFVSRYTRLRQSTKPDNANEIIDVVGQQNDEEAPFFELLKTKQSQGNVVELARKIKKLLNIEYNTTEASEDDCTGTEQLSVQNFESSYGKLDFGKKRVLQRILNIIFDLNLALLSFQRQSDEIMLRDSCFLKHAMRLRNAFNIPVFDRVLSKSVHWMLIEKLPVSFLAVYLELLQYCRHKLNSGIVDHLVAVEMDKKSISSDIMNFVQKRPQEANIMGSLLCKQPLKKSSRNFLFIMVSPLVQILTEKVSTSKMRHDVFYKRLLPLIGRHGVEVKFGLQNRQYTVIETTEFMKTTLREKILESKKQHPDATVILIAWDTSCLLACKIAFELPVAAVICLAFPNLTTNGARGDVDDDLLTVSCPVLFVVGQFSSTCCVDDLQDTRGMMLGNSGLVVVGGADHQLRVPTKKLRMENVCQDAIDCAVAEAISDFLVYAFESSPGVKIESLPVHLQFGKKEFDAEYIENKLQDSTGKKGTGEKIGPQTVKKEPPDSVGTKRAANNPIGTGKSQAKKVHLAPAKSGITYGEYTAEGRKSSNLESKPKTSQICGKEAATNKNAFYQNQYANAQRGNFFAVNQQRHPKPLLLGRGGRGTNSDQRVRPRPLPPNRFPPVSQVHYAPSTAADHSINSPALNLQQGNSETVRQYHGQFWRGQKLNSSVVEQNSRGRVQDGSGFHRLQLVPKDDIYKFTE